jgi:hypothetical protein
VEKEMGNDMLEDDKQSKIERAIANIVAGIGDLDDADRRELAWLISARASMVGWLAQASAGQTPLIAPTRV